MNLNKHIGHRLAVNQFGKEVELECLTCNETLATEPATSKIKAEAEAPVCTMEEGCVSCGS
ncbi:hypothetical protein [Pontibacter beigongshangensis]|uniref:hypothetical protein n=1 Tax=Pontibacter beigongshangensis TaxID=2574733 RepID=UPI00164F870B|nr:hypothetical protein [Pontibacter beigongshangensis]